MTSLALRSQSTLVDLVAVLNGFRELVGDDAQLRTRTVSVKHDGEWRNHATTMRLEQAASLTRALPMLLFRDVALFESVTPLDGSFTVESFTSHATGWRAALGAPGAFKFQQPIYVDREFSHPVAAPYPRWKCRLHEMAIGANTYSLPAGPFLAPDRNIFAPDLPSLTGYWLGETFWEGRTTLAYEYWLSIEDRRARIVELLAEDERLIVTVDGITRHPLYCGAAIKSFAGSERRLVERIVDSKAAFRFEASVQELSLWVMLQDGQALDSYTESPHRASWGTEKAIYNRPRIVAPELETALDAALVEGESQGVEFKPYIRLHPRDPKADELLETVCAFANAGGGTLFLGVSDNAEPIGIDVDLRRAYGDQCSADLDCLREAYVKDLRKLLNEGLVPAVIPAFKWYDLAHRWVLSAMVHPVDAYVSLIATGEVYRRVGATNRKLRPSDVLGDTLDA